MIKKTIDFYSSFILIQFIVKIFPLKDDPIWIYFFVNYFTFKIYFEVTRLIFN